MKEMRNINIKNKIIVNVLRVAAVLLLLVTIVFAYIAVVFSNSYDAPSIFGKNIYIVNTSAFSVLNEGTAMITSHVDGDQIEPGNIVIYRPVDSSVKADIAEIQSVNLSDGVYSYYAKDKLGNELFLVYSQIIGKGMSYSDFLGAIIRFLSSTGGLLAVAVIPCCVLIGFEFFQLAQRNSDSETFVKTIKKQNEVPTFVSSSHKGTNAQHSAAGSENVPLFTYPVRKSAGGQRSYENLTPAEKINRAIAETRAENAKLQKNENNVKKEPKNDIRLKNSDAASSTSVFAPKQESYRSETFEFEDKAIINERAAAVQEIRSRRSEKEKTPSVIAAERSNENREAVFEQKEKASDIGVKLPYVNETVSEKRLRTPREIQIKPESNERMSDDSTDVIEYIPRRQQRENQQRETASVKQPSHRRTLEPPRQRSSSYVNAVPSLDKLLAEERSAEKKFSIDEILASIESKNE